MVKGKQPDLILLGITNGNFENEINLARQMRKRDTHIPIICIAKNSSEAIAIAALKAGIDDFFKLPFSSEAVLKSIKKMLYNQPIQSKTLRVKGGCKSKAHPLMVGQSKSMQEVKQQLMKVAQSDCSVMITGETGTGKELATRTIHRNSDRKKTIGLHQLCSDT